MAGSDLRKLAVENDRLRRRLDRERATRKEAEAIAEAGLRNLYEKQRYLEFVAEISTAANQTRSVSDVFRFALSHICQFTGWTAGHAWIVDINDDRIEFNTTGVWYHDPKHNIEPLRLATEKSKFGIDWSLPGRVLQTTAAAWIPDIRADENFLRQTEVMECGFRAAFAFPVLIGTEVAAVLEFFADRIIVEDEAIHKLVSQAGTQLGRVIERDRAENHLYRASHDALTGLPNRAHFLRRLKQAVNNYRQNRDLTFAVLFIDLDQFKHVNDNIGHLAGDELIVQVAARLRSSVRNYDITARNVLPPINEQSILARLGGDEFTILLAYVNDANDAIGIADRIQDSLRQSMEIDGYDIVTTASIGITLASPDHITENDVLRDADLAMYKAKSEGKARSALFDRTMHLSAINRLDLEGDLRRALRDKAFVLHYQPVMALKTGLVVGFEALVRWQKPDGSLVNPDHFFQVAEETGLIVSLGSWVLTEACQTLKRWTDMFHCDGLLSMSVNLSGRQIGQPNIVQHVHDAIIMTGIKPTMLRLEIRESVAMGDAERVALTLADLRATGVRLSLDDFGTGFSSLSYLHKFPFDVLKIDRSFISRMESHIESLQIVRTIVSLARQMGLDVIAEGVETEAEIRRLQSLDCDYCQGYFFSRPLSAFAVEHNLQNKLWQWEQTKDPPEVKRLSFAG